MPDEPLAPEIPATGRFAIGFDARDRERLHELWDAVLDSERWAEGPMVERFEALWAARHGVGAVAMAAGPAAPWPPCATPESGGATRCCARRTRSWRPRWPP